MSAKTQQLVSSTWFLDILAEKKRPVLEITSPKPSLVLMEEEVKTVDPDDLKVKLTTPEERKKPDKQAVLETIKEIVSISKPFQLGEGHRKLTKGYKITIVYKDLKDKEHVKRIYFGSPKRVYFIDHKNIYMRSASLGRIRKSPSILESRFYEIKLLDGPHGSLEENYYALIKEILG